MHPAVTRYYVRHWAEKWWAYSYHPIKGETRPPHNRPPFSSAPTLDRLMNKLARRIEKNRKLQHRLNQAH